LGSFISVLEKNEANRRMGRQMLGIEEKAVCIAYFGFVLPGRNIDVLLDSIAGLRQEGVNAWGLIMGGEHPSTPGYLNKCRKYCENKGLKNFIVWTGFATDQQVAAGLAAADVFVSLPNRGADLRNTSIITAMRAQIPVITSHNERYFVDKDLVQMGCEIVPSRDITSLKTAIYKYTLSPPSPALLRQVSENLAPERIWTQHINILLEAFKR